MDDQRSVVGNLQVRPIDCGGADTPELFKRYKARVVGPDGHDRLETGDPCLKGGGAGALGRDGSVISGRLESSRAVESRGKVFKPPLPDGGALAVGFPGRGFQARGDFVLEPVTFAQCKQRVGAAAGHGFANGEIEAVEVGGATPFRMCAKRFNGGFKFPAGESAVDQASQENGHRVRAERTAEVEPGRDAEAVERGAQQGQISAGVANGNADLAEGHAGAIQFYDAAGDFIRFAFERAGLGDGDLRLAGFGGKGLILRTEFERESADVVGCGRNIGG